MFNADSHLGSIRFRKYWKIEALKASIGAGLTFFAEQFSDTPPRVSAPL